MQKGHPTNTDFEQIPYAQYEKKQHNNLGGARQTMGDLTQFPAIDEDCARMRGLLLSPQWFVPVEWRTNYCRFAFFYSARFYNRDERSTMGFGAARVDVTENVTIAQRFGKCFDLEYWKLWIV